jgi:large subunit ribosomal protein L22
MVRGRGVVEALDLLKFIPKKGARILSKVVASAAANAENNFNQDRKHLKISKILVTEGQTYKRHWYASRGRSYPLRKRTSHITVELSAGTEQGVIAASAPTAKSKVTVKAVKKEGIGERIKKKIAGKS